MKQPKKCRLCGCIDESGDCPTCVFCGEATWQFLAPAPEPETPPPTAPRKKSRR